MKNPTPVLFVRQKHDAKRAGLHYDYRIVIDDKAFSWASKKEFPEVGKPTILWEQPVHTAHYATTPSIVIPDGQYGAGTQVIDYAQKGSSQTINNDYHLELNNGDRFLIKKAPEHYGEKAWLFLRKKALDDKNPYLEKAAAAKNNDASVAMEGYAGLGLAASSKYLGKKVAEKMKPAIELHRENYMAKAKAAGKPFSKGYMSELVTGATTNSKMVDRANIAAKVTRKVAIGTGVAMIGHAAYRAYKGHDKKASESNVFLEKVAKKREPGDGAREFIVGVLSDKK
jgi:hypothetical protein